MLYSVMFKKDFFINFSMTFLDLSVNTTAEVMKSRLEGAMGSSVGFITVSTTGTCHGQSWHLTFKTVGGDISPLEVRASIIIISHVFRPRSIDL